ncbi:hypothetical protein ECZU26_14140 [Escherichia coli]|nr:hypothetical protein ECZU26_14140 [Escherichia coli]
MIRVACVGITVMDRIYYVEGLPTESGKYVAKLYGSWWRASGDGSGCGGKAGGAGRFYWSRR